MILTGAKFAIIGEALAGPRWKAVVARSLGKSERTIHDYAAGATNVPRDVRKRLAVLLYTRGTAQVRLALDLDPEIARTAGKSALDKQ